MARQPLSKDRAHGRPLRRDHAVPGRVAPASGILMCRRWMPSNWAGRASMAARERALRASVLSSTRSQPSVSNARRSRSSLHSTGP